MHHNGCSRQPTCVTHSFLVSGGARRLHVSLQPVSPARDRRHHGPSVDGGLRVEWNGCVPDGTQRPGGECCDACIRSECGYACIRTCCFFLAVALSVYVGLFTRLRRPPLDIIVIILLVLSDVIRVGEDASSHDRGQHAMESMISVK